MYSYTNPSFIKNSISFLKSISWGSFLDGTSKTLGVINQAIPIVYQVKPLVNNAKTLFKISNIINGESSNISNINNDSLPKNEKKETISNNSPIFYL